MWEECRNFSVRQVQDSGPTGVRHQIPDTGLKRVGGLQPGVGMFAVTGGKRNRAGRDERLCGREGIPANRTRPGRLRGFPET